MEALGDLVGRRVSLRHRVGLRDGRPLLTDAVGELADGGAGEVVVHTRRGPVRVRHDAVVAVRAVPPARPRRPSWAAVQQLELVCAAAAGGSVEARVPVGSPAETELRRQGVALSEREVVVLVAELAELAALPELGSGPAAMIAASGHPTALTTAGRPVAAITGVRATVVDEHVHVSALGGGDVGLADAVRDAAAGGARWAVAEAPSDDPAALARWQGLGFVTHHRVRYLAPGAPAATCGLPSPPA